MVIGLWLHLIQSLRRQRNDSKICLHSLGIFTLYGKIAKHLTKMQVKLSCVDLHLSFLVSGSVQQRGNMIGKDMRQTTMAFHPWPLGNDISMGSSTSSSSSALPPASVTSGLTELQSVTRNIRLASTAEPYFNTFLCTAALCRESEHKRTHFSSNIRLQF